MKTMLIYVQSFCSADARDPHAVQSRFGSLRQPVKYRLVGHYGDLRTLRFGIRERQRRVRR
jgi:hypothetical protein